MQVKTQPFKEALELKSDGISFDVYGNGSKRLGDLCVSKSGLVWSKGPNGKATRSASINVKWEEFINWVQSRRATAVKTASKSSAQGIASMRAAAQKQAAAGGKLSSSRKSSIKLPSQAGKVAAQRAAAMKLAATTSAKSRTAAAKLAHPSGQPAKLSGQNGKPAKLPSAKTQQGKTAKKAPAAVVRKPASKPSSAARKAN